MTHNPEYDDLQIIDEAYLLPSEMNTSLNNFVDAFHDSYGFCPMRIYCIATGKQIGTMYDEEIESIIGDWQGDDTVIDDVATRLLASMRPSIQWNKMREETLDDMRRRNPVDTLAYLLNRLLAPSEFKQLSLERRLDNHADRIKLHSWLVDAFDSNSDLATKILHMLIEIDARLGLESQPQPFNYGQFGTLLELFNLVADWYAERLKVYQAKVKHDEEMQRWNRHGNPLAKQAFGAIWRETKPLTKTEIVKAEKRKESRFFENIFDELMAGNVESTPTQTEAPKPQVVKPLRLGKLNLAKKG